MSANEPDRLLRLIVAERGRCERCGTHGAETAHIIRRRYQATRFLEDNVWFLCHGCHHAVDNYVLAHADLVDETIGPERLVELMHLAQAGPPEPLSMWHRTETARLRERCRELAIPTRRAS